MNKKLMQFFPDLATGQLLFPTFGIMHFANTGFVVPMCIFPSAGNYF